MRQGRNGGGGVAHSRGLTTNASGLAGCEVSDSHTAEEKPRLQIQEDQVLSLLFYEEERGAAGAQQLLGASRPKG